MSSEMFDPQEVESRGRWILIGAYVIYLLAIGFAEVMFVMMLSDIFTGWHPLFVGFAAVGAVATGLTAALLPIAKIRWIASQEMNIASWIFWLVELGVLILNTMLAFDLATGATDSWVAWWRHISPASPLLTILIWGTLISMHPTSKKQQDQMQFAGKVDSTISNHLMRELNSDAVKGQIRQASNLLVDQFLELKFGGMLNPTRHQVVDGKLREPDKIIGSEPGNFRPAPQPVMQDGKKFKFRYGGTLKRRFASETDDSTNGTDSKNG